MKLSILTQEAISGAAKAIDRDGIPKDSVWSQYYVVVDGKEYPFKHLVYEAFKVLGVTDVKFESNDGYRNYMVGTMGYQMEYYPGGYNFFTRDELDYYASIARKPYRKDNPAHQVYPQRLNALIAKVNYWGRQVTSVAYTFRADRHWLTGNTANIKPYFWPRMYKGRDEDIFFNVEVNGDKRTLSYKMDGYYHTTKKMPDDKIAILNEYKNEGKWYWPEIKFEDISNYNWDRLIAETKAYINRFDGDYDLLRRRLDKKSIPAFISWNTNRWVFPSGLGGKDISLPSMKDNGFGYDEWLFDSDKVIDGYQYGYLQVISDGYGEYEGRIFDIPLFTLDAGSIKTYYVATLKNVEVIDSDESVDVLERYRGLGWLDEMSSEVKGLGNDFVLDFLSPAIDASYFVNIRFKAAQLGSLPLELLELETSGGVIDGIIPAGGPIAGLIGQLEEKTRKGFSFEDSGSTEADLKKKGKRKSYTVEREMEFRHNRIQEKLLKHLQALYPGDVTKRECSAYGGCRIDLVRKTGTGYVFYEIKTYNNLLTSVRLGIGQLLEYSLFPLEQQAEKLVLVSDQKATPQVESYICHLKTFLNLDFSYLQYDPDTDRIEREI
ncbi:hypothetical protein [Pedobacter miscanthi]|uniref:hypothetical protein n=1 Tax=Pedobacter miscanthi TaxID=2259170 RepID=UPI00292DB296|nr:hypothetical protein [Pedobacter miscanthi]